MAQSRVFAFALLGSLALHVTVAVLVIARAPRVASAATARPATTNAWIGDTCEIDELIEDPAPPLPSPAAPPVPALAKTALRSAAPVSEPRAPVPEVRRSAKGGDGEAAGGGAAKMGSTFTSDDRGPSTDATRPAASAALALASSGSAALAAASGPNGGTYGAVGNGEGLRDLEPAFVRALPAAAASRKPDWEGVEPNATLLAEVTLKLELDGRLADLVVEPGAPIPLVQLLRRVRWLLARGRFALPEALPANASPRYAIAARVSHREPEPNPFADPGDIMRRGFVPARSGDDEPAHAYFTFASGLHVDLTVRKADAGEASTSRASAPSAP
ncbi:MAG: hypothetical protein JW751_13520 [Polyangiaceae bacterium]|nr:hypothetical protein [Polyangiaceae bacterium]